MSVIDDRGRIFGVNLVDALVLAFLLLALPIAYGTWLLFHPPRVQIDAVSQVPLTNEQRIADPLRAAARLKLRGDGFTPMLRAWIGSDPAIGFIYESPNSAEVIVGPAPPGEYDVALYDGGQEVARAPKAYAIRTPANVDRIKAVGRFVDLAPDVAERLQAGASYPSGADARVHVAAIGPVESGRRPLLVQSTPQPRRLDVPRDGTVNRDATLVLACDPTNQPDTTCMISGVFPATNAQLRVAGPIDLLTFIVDELMPAAPAEPMDVAVRLNGGPELASIKIGDRDNLLDERAAVVTAIAGRQSASVDVHLRLGADRGRDGWRYRGRVIKTGAPFTFTTERYTLAGVVLTTNPAAAGESR